MEQALKGSEIRNVGLMAHIDAGKTTTSERILYYTGRIRRMGEVDKGTATLDWMQQEQERGITISSAASRCLWRDWVLNLIDTPGHVDFTAEVERTLRILDGAVVIFCAVAGVEPQSEKVWRQADRYGLPKLIYINKMDRAGADFFGVVEDINRRLGNKAVIIQIPWGTADAFCGIIDLLELTAYVYRDDLGDTYEARPLTGDLREEASYYRELLVEKLAEHDDTVLTGFLEKDPVTPEQLRSALRRLTLNNIVVPVTCGSSQKNQGVQLLLDAIGNYLPSPLDTAEITGEKPLTGEPLHWKKLEAPLCGLIFKIAVDPYVGKIAYLRIFSGELSAGAKVLNSSGAAQEHITRLFRMHGGDREEISRADLGDIVAVSGLKHTMTGDTLCDPAWPIVLEAIDFPAPVVDIVIEPVSRAEEAKLDETLKLLQQEDPSFHVRLDPESGQRILSGMGELHLEVIVRRILEEFKVSAQAGKPRVAYRESIIHSAKAAAEVDRVVLEHRLYAGLTLKVSPREAGAGNQVDIGAGARDLRESWLEAVRQGVRETLQSGVLAGYPLEDVRVELLKGAFREGASNEQAFKIAAGLALREALTQAELTLMEPVMSITLLTPEAHVGSIIADINARRGHITDIREQHGVKELTGEIALAETFGYATKLRSLSQGRASFMLRPARYAKLSQAQTREVLK
jgi:elongation factor G